MQCYYSGALSRQVYGFYVKHINGYIIFHSTKTERGASRLLFQR
jgi:hypothetical protein